MDFLHYFSFFFIVLLWLATGWGWGDIVSEACRVLGVSMGQLGWSAGVAFPVAHGGLLNWIHAIVKICVHLMSTKSSICSFPHLVLPPSHVAHHSVLCMGWERNESLGQHLTQLGKLGAHTHSPFPPCEKSWAKEDLSWPCAMPPWERCNTNKVKLFL